MKVAAALKVLLTGLKYFCVLQILDIITTLIVFHLGGREVNGLVGFCIKSTGSPLMGLLFSKAIILAVALVAWRYRPKAVRTANLLFAAIVTWNVTIIFRLLRL